MGNRLGKFCGVIWILLLLLWGCFLYLRSRAQTAPRYFYFLPQDAECVRLDECVVGMRLAAKIVPKALPDLDLLDMFARSIAVTTRTQVFPGGILHGYQYTNNFYALCDLAAEGCIQGYQGMMALYQRDITRYEDVAALLVRYEEQSERRLVKQAIYDVAREMLDTPGKEQSDSSGEEPRE